MVHANTANGWIKQKDMKETSTKKKRIDYIDLLKGFAIFCVLWGHSLQYLRNGADFFHNPVFEFIYSFHMPLFFLISGFFFKSSLKLNFKNFLLKKSIQLLLPCFVWACLAMCMRLGKCFHNEIYNLDLVQEIKSLTRWPFWFLQELFMSYILIYVGYKILRKEWLVFILSIIFVLVVSFCRMQRFLLPLFLAGIFLENKYLFVQHHLKWFLCGSGLVFGMCLFFWDGNYTIYVTRFPSIINLKTLSFNFSNINIALFRLLTGLSGSIFFFTLFQRFYKTNKFCSYAEKIGTYTLSIYVLQVIILEKCINNLIDFQEINIWIYSLILTPLIALLVLFICMTINRLMRNKYLQLLLFGNLK
jgi:fucose 4-O-acetylase-like acetyltransferase